jgi:lipooligosaccharide transport system ATP-binding protein
MYHPESGVAQPQELEHHFMSELAIRVSDVTKCFGTLTAVDSLEFQVPHGASFGFLGPNGAGKTTMMHMIYGRARRDCYPSGTIQVFGHDPHTDELAIKYLAGVVPQEDNLDTELTVTQNLMIYARFYGIPAAEAKRRIDRLLELMELKDKHKSRIRQLSGGMKRRLIIARALINNPRLLILDEPTTGLDPQVRHAIWEKIRQLKKEGLTVLLTTHYMEEAFQICDTVLIMHKGKKILQGDPRGLIHDNIERYVLEVLRAEALAEVDGAAAADKIRKDDSREVVMLYSQEVDALRNLADRLPPGDYVLRQSNLEDVFLKATGRALSEIQ